jgi:hypothetical protein
MKKLLCSLSLLISIACFAQPFEFSSDDNTLEKICFIGNNGMCDDIVTVQIPTTQEENLETALSSLKDSAHAMFTATQSVAHQCLKRVRKKTETINKALSTAPTEGIQKIRKNLVGIFKRGIQRFKNSAHAFRNPLNLDENGYPVPAYQCA